jgi:hypothetical protein
MKYGKKEWVKKQRKEIEALREDRGDSDQGSSESARTEE